MGDRAMKQKDKITIYIGVLMGICATTIVITPLSAQTEAAPFRYLISLPKLDPNQINALKEIVPLASTDTEARRLAPKISKDLLTDPSVVTRQSVTYTHIDFVDNQLWGQGKWVFKHMTQATPGELNAQQRERLVARLPAERRADKVYVKQYLDGKLQDFKKRRVLSLAGLVQIELTATPSSNAAREFMISRMTLSTLPPEMIIHLYTNAERPQALGDLSFSIASRADDQAQIKFIRDNIYVEVRAQDTLTADALPIAKKIDRMIMEQPILSAAQIREMKPLIKLSSKSKGILSYTLSDIEDQEIVSIYGLTNGQRLPVKTGEVSIVGRSTDSPIKVIAITDRLLVGVGQL
jgi:hypothetical protein